MPDENNQTQTPKEGTPDQIELDFDEHDGPTEQVSERPSTADPMKPIREFKFEEPKEERGLNKEGWFDRFIGRKFR